MYLLDTNILIYHFNNNIPESSSKDINSILKNHFNISVITKIEFLGYRGHTSESFKAAKSFLDEARIYYLEEKVVDSVIEIRKENSINMADAIIASTAIVNNFTLVTRNVDDFKDLGIEILNPFSLDE